jgi:hypothetical protein
MAGNNQLDLSTLTPQQLDGLRQQMESELQQLTHSMQTMQAVANQYVLSGQAINNLESQVPGTTHSPRFFMLLHVLPCLWACSNGAVHPRTQ